jgi:hypothetical protein
LQTAIATDDICVMIDDGETLLGDRQRSLGDWRRRGEPHPIVSCCQISFGESEPHSVRDPLATERESMTETQKVKETCPKGPVETSTPNC